MKILIVLPQCEIAAMRLQRILQATSSSFASCSQEIAAPTKYAEFYRQELPGYEILSYESLPPPSRYEAVIFAEGDSGESVSLSDNAVDYDKWRQSQLRIYRMDNHCRLTLLNLELDSHEYPYLDTHAFNRLSHRIYEGFYYFPYGYLYRWPGLGPINDFGYRITHDFSVFENREAEHKVIAVFGGSAAWSVYCRYEEMFSARLEKMLNDYATKEIKECRFSVVNFSLPGHVILNEIMTFALWCYKIRPDMIIAHDGYNDFYYGQISDSYLLNKYNMTYQYVHEMWSQTLFNTKHVKLNWSVDQDTGRESFIIANNPRSIVAAYTARQLQFQEMARGIGAKFIAGLQPSIFGRSNKSSEEKLAMKSYLEGIYGKIHKGIHFLYEKYLQIGSYKDLQHFVNLNQHFSACDETRTLFADCVHTVPEGDDVIAKAYFEFIRDEVLTA